jgi:hypothetical protein
LIFRDKPQNLLEHQPWDCDLGHLEHDVTTVAHHLGADLDQILLEGGQRPITHRFRRRQRMLADARTGKNGRQPEASFPPGSDRRRPCATCILLLKLLQAPHLRWQRAVVLFLPDEVGRLADADLADVSHRHAVAALLPTPSERPNISMLSSLSALPSQKIDAEDSTLAGLRVPRGHRLGALCG